MLDTAEPAIAASATEPAVSRPVGHRPFDALAAHHDVEVALVILEALERLHTDFGVPPVLMRVNNRKLAEGFYRGLGIGEPGGAFESVSTLDVLQRVDKFDKIGADAFTADAAEAAQWAKTYAASKGA